MCYLFLWHQYFNSDKDHFELFGRIAIIFSLLIVILSSVFTYFSLTKESLKGHLREYSFSALVFFFSSFLAVTYHLSFAFAFYDKLELCNGSSAFQYQSLFMEKRQIESYSPNIERYCRSILFEEGSAVVDEEHEKIISQLCKEIKEIEQYENCKVGINLAGHTSSPSLRKDYNTNYELAEARMKNVQWHIINTLYSNERQLHNIEWTLIPIVSEGDFLCKSEEKKKDASNDKQQRVEIILLPIKEKYLDFSEIQIKNKKLLLMDYIYFTIYTITTTGYGDIIPVTSQAKFISSIANLYELFFIVVFFNILSNISCGPPGPPGLSNGHSKEKDNGTFTKS